MTQQKQGPGDKKHHTLLVGSGGATGSRGGNRRLWILQTTSAKSPPCRLARSAVLYLPTKGVFNLFTGDPKTGRQLSTARCLSLSQNCDGSIRTAATLESSLAAYSPGKCARFPSPPPRPNPLSDRARTWKNAMHQQRLQGTLNSNCTKSNKCLRHIFGRVGLRQDVGPLALTTDLRDLEPALFDCLLHPEDLNR